MFPQGARFIQDINEVIDMFPEDKDDEFLSSAESRPKREIYGAGIDQLLMSFDGNTYSSGGKYEGTRVKI